MTDAKDGTGRGAANRAANSVDAHVGRRLRELRDARGLTRKELSARLGRGFKQVRKYESGENRISAGMLYLAAQHLDVEVTAFFEGLDLVTQAPDEPDLRAGIALAAEVPDAERLRQALDLCRNFEAIGDPARREVFVSLVKSVSESAQFNR